MSGSSLAPLFSSETDEWPTPPALFARLNAKYRFTLDPCATAENAKCPRYFTREQDGLAQPWAPERVFMNPPYGRPIGAWLAKAWQESRRGALVVCLLPARTCTSWWHDYVERADHRRFVRGRLRFGDATNAAPFPSAVVVFEPSAVTARPVIRNACEGCRGPVLTVRRDARFCSGACRQAAYRRRAASRDAPTVCSGCGAIPEWVGLAGEEYLYQLHPPTCRSHPEGPARPEGVTW